MKANTVSQLTLLDSDAANNATHRRLTISSNLCYENAHTVVEAVSSVLVEKPAKVVLEMGSVCMIHSSGLKVLPAKPQAL